MSDDLVGIVGESFRQDALMRLLAAHPDRACLVKLIAEPDNPVDPNAIKVVSADDDAMLGYISRAEAVGFHAAVDALGANTPIARSSGAAPMTSRPWASGLMRGRCASGGRSNAERKRASAGLIARTRRN